MDELTSERNYWLALSLCEGIGPVQFQKLLRHFGSAKNVWDASFVEPVASGIREKIAKDLTDFKVTFFLSEHQQIMQKLHVSYLTLQDEDYPELLQHINKPPTILYKKGTYSFNKSDILVSVVGTRKITEYGKTVTELLVRDLVAAGCVIVSGLAIGVDAPAAQAAIAAGGKPLQFSEVVLISVRLSKIRVCTMLFWKVVVLLCRKIGLTCSPPLVLSLQETVSLRN